MPPPSPQTSATSRSTPPAGRARVNCGLVGLGTVGSAVLSFFAGGPLSLPLGSDGRGPGSHIPIHLWSASRRTRDRHGVASSSTVRRVLEQAGPGGEARFFYDVDPADPTSHFNHGAPAWRRIVEDPEVDIVVEMTGSPVAEAIIEEALWSGKSVVTANKKVMSRSGYQLARLAESRGAVLAYEASVGGGMPVVQMIGSSIGGRVHAILAIINGTTNFILSAMWEGLRETSGTSPSNPYPAALANAVRAGLAEADPSDDVLAEDARSKLIILAGLAFGVRLRPSDVYLRGIARRGRLTEVSIFSASDLAVLKRLGYVPKLLAGAQRHQLRGEERIVAWAQPAAVSEAHPLAGVAGSENACLLRVESPVLPDGAGKGYDILVRGPGAGGPETASSVIADIMFCARQLAVAGRLGQQAFLEGSRPAGLYNYGTAVFSRSQEYLGLPSLSLAEALVAPFLLRFNGNGDLAVGSPAASVIQRTLNESGVESNEIAAPASSGSLYLKTAPASIGVLERAVESVLRECGPSMLDLDVLFLPILEGTSWPDRNGENRL